jgi:hypothetical protein
MSTQGPLATIAAAASAITGNARPNSVSGSTAPPTGAPGDKASIAAIMFFGVLGLALYIWSAVTVSKAHSESKDYGTLKSTVPTLIAQTLVGTLLLYGAMLMYSIQDLKVMIYILMVMVFLTFSFSYAAVAIAAMSR